MNVKRMLMLATQRLLETRDFTGISVSAITTEAGVSRSTFYLHYTDKYDLVNSFYRDYMSNEIMLHLDGKNYQEICIRTLEFLLEYRTFFRKTLAINGQDSLQEFARQYIVRAMLDVYRNRIHAGQKTPGKALFQAECLADMQIANMKKFEASGMIVGTHAA